MLEEAGPARLGSGAARPDGSTWQAIIADDHVVTRAGLKVLLELTGRVEVVGEAADGVEALRLCMFLQPSLVTLDLRMPRMDGLHALRQIKRCHPDVAVLMLSAEGDPDLVIEALDAGAAGWMMKTGPLSEYQRALESIDAGEDYLSPSISGAVVRRFSTSSHVGAHRLTDREILVLGLIRDGLTAGAAARRLGLSERTVSTHLGNVYRKLGVNNKVEALFEAIRLGLMDPPREPVGSVLPR